MVWFFSWMVIFTKPFTEALSIFWNEPKTKYMDPIVTLCNFTPNPQWTTVNVHIAKSTKVFLIFSYLLSLSVFLLFLLGATILNSWVHGASSKILLVLLSVIVLLNGVSLYFFYQFSCSSKYWWLGWTVSVKWMLEKIVKESSAVTTIKSLMDFMIPFLRLYLAWLLPFHFFANLVPLGCPFCFWGFLCWYICCVFKRFVAVL